MSWQQTTVAAAAALLVMAAQTAIADESGSFRSLRSYQHHCTTVDHGETTFIGGPIKGTGTIIESSGGPFVEGANSVFECVVLSRSGPTGILLEGPCADTDSAGDFLYSRAVRKQGDVSVDGGGEGVWELLGGTGAYAGITGSCSYRTQYLEGDLAVALADCTWSKS